MVYFAPSPPLAMGFSLVQVVVASYDNVFPSEEEGAKDVDDNCE